MQNAKILIVDDEPFNVDYLEQELDELHYATVSAADGYAALAKVQSEAPDLVLLDIMMPGLDGFEVLRRLRIDPATRDLPVIVISADNNLQSVVNGIELGAEDYLPKPFEPVLLRARIASCLEKKHLRDLQQLYLKGLERELDIARTIQQGFLPAELPRVPGWEIAAYFKAAREVAGDFYDAFLLPNGNLVCVIGDVCGKGVGAALFMTLFRSLIRATATSDLARRDPDLSALSPAECLQHVVAFTNRYVAHTHGAAGIYTTLFIGLFNPQTGQLTYINGGNEPALLVQAGDKLTALRATGPVVGTLPDADYAVKEIVLAPGDMVLMFTDGLPDACDTEDTAFGKDRVRCRMHHGVIAPALLLEQLQAELHEFIGAAGQFDDITLLAVKRVE